ncbi:MAG: hypothetical protein J6A50_04430 [Clostridia bacterium]|nr:hypothetical protein [Clostridia bacterium]
MYEFEKIKLVIWDLDETFWQGTVTEGNIIVPENNVKLIKRLTDIGIVNSICSKNDAENVKARLEQMGLWEYFVFPSVNWEPKGQRIKTLISDMQLRAPNVLFLDDNHSNREEAKYFNEGIMVADPDEIENLLSDAMDSTKEDKEHKRLKQYKVLEEKHTAKSAYSSNEAFLAESNIKLEIKKDCLNELKRIEDLILRANQLNFTKVRSSAEDLAKTLNDPAVSAGYVSVKDKFGDYGIVGFYAMKENKLLHFVFSCRTLGMGIEQYTYNYLGRPELEIVGEVISDLSSTELPHWINNDDETVGDGASGTMSIDNLKAHTVLIKGPCDLFQVFPYISQTELFDTEFTYSLPNNLTIESTGHTTHVVEALRLSEEQKKRVIDEVPFTDIGIYNDNIYKKGYKVVFLSILADANLGVYRRKDTGERFAFIEYLHPVTDRASWPGLISGEYNCAGFKFTEEILEEFSEQYEFIGRNSPEQIVENLRYIRKNLPEDCLLAVMLGGEMYYEKNTFEAYKDRHIVHKNINGAVRKLGEEVLGIRLLDVNKYLVDQSSFYDHFNHYIKPVYYKLAEEMVSIVNEHTGSKVKKTSKAKMVVIKIKEALAPYWYKVRGLLKRK